MTAQASVPCGKACKCENCHNKAPEGAPEEEPEQSLALAEDAAQVSWDPLKAPPQLVIPPLPGAATTQCVVLLPPLPRAFSAPAPALPPGLPMPHGFCLQASM